MLARETASLALALALAATATACTQQPWVFRNGVDLDDQPPAELLVEVYSGDECGFACQPPGERIYCDLLEGSEQGAAPAGLVQGERYCFLGTAIDAQGAAYAIGCAVAEVGGGDIDITLAPLDEQRFIARRCDTGINIDIDAGPRLDAAAPDSGGRDGGPTDSGGVDAGRPDAGPPIDGGPPPLPNGTDAIVTIRPTGPGGARVTLPGRIYTLGSGSGLTVEAYVGFQVRIEPLPASGARHVTTTGGCHLDDPCDFTFTRSGEILVVFE